MHEFSVEVNKTDKTVGSNDVVVVKTCGSINTSTTPTLDGQFEDLIAKKHYTLVVDLTDTVRVSESCSVQQTSCAKRAVT